MKFALNTSKNMENKHTVYIPSKGRADIKGTISLLKKENINYFVVIEKEEFDAYSKVTDKILVLPESNKGISYSRTWIKKHSVSKGENFHWQMDDDITSFCKRLPNQVNISALDAIKIVEDLISDYDNIGIAGLNFNAWPPKNNDIILNRPVYRCVLINNESKSIWHDKFVLLEDWEYSMQLLSDGYATMLFDYLRVNSIKPGVLDGGLKSVYEIPMWRENVLSRLVQKYPDCEIKKSKYNWIDARKFFKKHNNPLNKRHKIETLTLF